MCRSTDRTAATVLRELDGEERRLIVSVPWAQRPIETYQAVRPLLSREEAEALAAAFDLDPPEAS